MDGQKLQFKCDFCEKSFFDEEILGLHIKSNHKSVIEGWKKCDFCDKTYRLKDSLYAHVRMTHSNQKFMNVKLALKYFLKDPYWTHIKKLFMKE